MSDLEKATELLRLWLVRLAYSDPYGDAPKIRAFLDSLQPQGESK